MQTHSTSSGQGKILTILAVAVMIIMTGCSSDFMDVAGKGPVNTIWLDEMDISKVPSGDGPAQANKSVGGNPITLNAKQYERGLGVNAPSDFYVDLYGRAKRLTAVVGIDDEVKNEQQQQQTRGRRRRGASVDFKVVGDGKLLWESGVRRANSEPNEIDIDLTGIKKLRLIAKEVDSNYNDHADWAMAKIEYTGRKAPVALDAPVVEKYILTPKPGPRPRITGPRIFGVRPGNPFLFTATATGNRPISFSVKGLPAGLSIDSNTGQITGSVNNPGTYNVTIVAKNSLGTAERDFRIVVGDTIALTPPMGWNSWNCWGPAVDDKKVRASAKAMYDTGLINHGWSYINIDDVWMRAENESRRTSSDPNLAPPARDPNGNILPNGRFPDMKGLCDYIHGLGLKAGIYIGPGPTTCQGLVASWQHELQDARQFADWGFDYLKYDWCGYSSVSGRESLEDLQRPYILMRTVLDQVNRDIVYSICQYGWGDVWEWGAKVGGNCWRTTGDIRDTWSSMARGFNEADHWKYSSPGHWNDPDMMVLGKVGWGPNLRDSRLTPDEQYTHMSLWCLLDAPLLLGCPIEQLDEFTLGLLTNDEVLEVNQDPLGQQARRIVQDGDKEIWAKKMEDGSMAVGLFNRYDYAEQKITLNFADLNFDGRCLVRDLWRQKNLGTFSKQFTATVPVHGVVLVRVTEK
jgi:alpha-galactosidase